jgi:hypothetical protein
LKQLGPSRGGGAAPRPGPTPFRRSKTMPRKKKSEDARAADETKSTAREAESPGAHARPDVSASTREAAEERLGGAADGIIQDLLSKVAPIVADILLRWLIEQSHRPGAAPADLADAATVRRWAADLLEANQGVIKTQLHNGVDRMFDSAVVALRGGESPAPAMEEQPPPEDDEEAE